MTNQEPIKRKRRIWPWVILAVIVILLGSVRLAMRSDWVLDMIRAEVETRASEQIPAELRIGRLEGDLWSHLTITNIQLFETGEISQNNDQLSSSHEDTAGYGEPVTSIESLYISYSIADLLFRRPLRIRQVHVDGLRADLRQDEEGEWNILSMIAQDDEPDVDDPDDSPFQFVIEDIRIAAPEIAIEARALLPDEPLAIRDVIIQARAGQIESGLFVDLSELELSIHESRLDAPVTVASDASWDGRRITLDKLVVASAYSLAEITGRYDTTTSSVDIEALLDPIAWQEVEAYLDTYPLRQDLTVQMHVGGSRQDLQASISLDAPGLEDFHLDSQWSILQEPVLTSLDISFNRLDLPELTASDELDARIGRFDFSLDGSIPLPEWDRVQANGAMAFRDLHYGEHSLDQLDITIDAQQGSVHSEITLHKGEESIFVDVEADRWWDTDIDWKLAYRTDGINPALWSGVDDLDGVVVASGTITGQGLEPSGSTPWIADLEMSRIHIADYPEVSVVVNGTVIEDSLQFSMISTAESARIIAEGSTHWRTEEPVYNLAMQFEDLNAAVIPGMEDLETDINGRISVSGQGTDPETLALNASLIFDESRVSGQNFETIQMDITLREGILTVDDAVVSGPPASVNFTLNQNIFDLRDPQNRLDFNMELNDLQGFAGLAGVDTLRARGTLTGSIQPDTNGVLVFGSEMLLEDLQYDTLRVSEIEGYTRVTLTEDVRYHADLEIRNPSVGTYSIRDIMLRTDGVYAGSAFEGSYEFELNVENESGLRQHADYHVADTIQIHTRLLELTDPAGMYELQKPFDVILADGIVKVDTLHLASDESSELTLSLQKTPGNPWEGFVEAQNTNLGQVQYVFLEEPLFGAIFTGRVGFLFDDDRLEVDAYAELSEIQYNELELDSMRLTFDLAEKRLMTETYAWYADRELLQSEFSLPFDLNNLEDPDPAFFEEEISGYIRVDTLDLAMFENVLEGLGLDQMYGELSFNTQFSGVAGVPEITGELRLTDGALSGVEMDTLLLSWHYDHDLSYLELTSQVYSLGQQAADISGNIPLHIDITKLEFQGPDPDDELDISVHTNDFDLAALNDFLNPQQMRDLQGKLNADVEIRGTFSNPDMDGSVALTDGQIRIVENNITLRSIRLDVGLSPGAIELRELAAQSSGSFNGSGSITLDGMTPDELDLRFNATNFRAFNTRDIEVFAGLNLRLTGSMEDPRLAGDVIWERGTIYLDDFGEREVEEVILEDEEEDAGIPDGPALYDRMSIEVNFRVDRNAFIRNRRDPEINLALRGNLDLLKEPLGDLQLFGDMEIPSGEVTTFNKRFQLETGSVLFSGDPTDPELNIRTLYRPRQQYEDIRIYFVITGNVSDPEFEYESEPEMELQDIISYVIFGRPFHALAGWEQTVSGRSDGSMATNIAVDILLDRIESLASDRLGIDVIEIENTRKGGGSGTSIKAGKFVSDRLFIAFLQELGGSEAGRQVVVEYMISRNLELILTASEDYRSGLDMLWRYDY